MRLSEIGWQLALQAQSVIDAPGGTAMQADSPFTDYTSRVLLVGLITGVLFAVLIIGGILIVNLGLLSKRRQDRTGGRTPSDVGILKENVWPEAPYEVKDFPAEEEEGSFAGPSREPAKERRIQSVQENTAGIRALRERMKRQREEARRVQQMTSGEDGPPGLRLLHSQSGTPVVEHDMPPEAPPVHLVKRAISE